MIEEGEHLTLNEEESAELDTIVAQLNKRQELLDEVVDALIKVCDFFPGDAEDCAHAVMPLLAEAWRLGYGEGDAFQTYGKSDPNPYEFWEGGETG